VDTGRGTVDRLAVDRATGRVTGRTTVVRVPPDEGMPDGLTLDADGHLWLALWGGGSVRRYAPSGSLDRVVELPVDLVTSVTFGGPGLAELFITTAHEGLTATQRLAQPLAGSVFRHRPGISGRPAEEFSG
jgi:sugar lactone lactonase YvrE